MYLSSPSNTNFTFSKSANLLLISIYLNMADLEPIKKQVEYYLSDLNLEHDEFFHNEISKSGVIPLSLILKCNKIKKLNANEEKVISALQLSDQLEITENKEAIRRKGDRPLPELKPRKQVKLNDGQGAQVAPKAEPKEVDNPYLNFEPLLFKIALQDKTAHVSWLEIKESLMKQQNISAPYVRFGKGEGNIALSKNRTPQENIDRITNTGLKIGTHQLEISLLQGDELAQFFSHHGKHLQTVIDREAQAFQHGGAGKGAGRRKEDQLRKLRKEIVFHNQKYRDISQLKNIFKNILTRSQNNTPLKEPYHSMVASLLAYHDKKDQKLSNLKHFTVGQHPEHKDTRCFFAVKEDGTQEDFSCLKCIKNFEAQLG